MWAIIQLGLHVPSEGLYENDQKGRVMYFFFLLKTGLSDCFGKAKEGLHIFLSPNLYFIQSFCFRKNVL